MEHLDRPCGLFGSSASARFCEILALPCESYSCGLIMSHYICQGIESDRVICFVHAASAAAGSSPLQFIPVPKRHMFPVWKQKNDSQWNQVWNLDDYACSRGLAGNRMRFSRSQYVAMMLARQPNHAAPYSPSKRVSEPFWSDCVVEHVLIVSSGMT